MFIDVTEINYYKMHMNVLMVKALNSVITQRKNMIYVYAGLIKQWIHEMPKSMFVMQKVSR